MRIKKDTDLSFMKGLGVGGDHLNTKLEEAMDIFLQQHKAHISVCKGYGMTEISSCAVSNSFAECNALGSVGIPFPKTCAKIVDTLTGQEMKYNEIGELYLTSTAIFAGYLNDDKATAEEIATDEAGTKWIKTGDLFSMNERGELFFQGRLKMMIVRPDGHNNHPRIMSELILKHSAVKDVCTVGVSSTFGVQGQYPKAVIVLKDEYKGQEQKVQIELEKMCMEHFSQRDVPYYYEFVDELPITANGKVDYQQLEETGIVNAHRAEIARIELG
jgi:long-chain acyl-CoA synthetase